MLPQVIHINDAQNTASAGEVLRVTAELPRPNLSRILPGGVSLLPGLFRERRELTKSYVLRLQTEDILQNHLLEAGVRIDKPCEQMHQGWEAPACQLRGHFAGHWLSAVSRFAATDHNPLLVSRASEVVQGLERCQKLNQGRWVGSIPEKYFAILTAGKEPIWSPQYVLHKTMMGLFDAHIYLNDTSALEIAEHSADWFLEWSEQAIQEGRSAAVYGGECAGMLELWANLYGATNDSKYLILAARYAMPDLFRELLAGRDPLSHAHCNASIPWIQGAARLYEVTGDVRYRQIVEMFWKQAVETRGMFATTGNNAGEFWIPPYQFGHFLGSRTQEHCTVYNMIRVAETLLRWTGDSRYADYIERALYNGILAQQNPIDGLVCYFLPLQPGSKKVWGSEKQDFWCCHGTLVQAQAMFEDLIYYRAEDGVTVSQFIASQASVGTLDNAIHISQKVDARPELASATGYAETTHTVIELTITCDHASEWVLRIRLPSWAAGHAAVSIDGIPVSFSVSAAGFLEIRRSWLSARVEVSFPKRVTREPLPGDPQRFALLDGPIVLAALSDSEPVLATSGAITPQYEHQYIDGREWQRGHFLVRTRCGTVTVKPIHEIVDERYCVYFASDSEQSASTSSGSQTPA